MLNERSEQRLLGVHLDLCRVVRAARVASPFRFEISEGLRSKARQAELVKAGKSQTQNSRHLTGHAVDIVILNNDGSANWSFDRYKAVADVFKKEAARLGIKITWGGDWKTLRDGPHFELDRATYQA